MKLEQIKINEFYGDFYRNYYGKISRNLDNTYTINFYHKQRISGTLQKDFYSVYYNTLAEAKFYILRRFKFNPILEKFSIRYYEI